MAKYPAVKAFFDRHLGENPPKGRPKALSDAVGVEQATVSRWRHGESRPGPETWAAVAGFFDVDVIDVDIAFRRTVSPVVDYADPLAISQLPDAVEELRALLAGSIDRVRELTETMNQLAKQTEARLARLEGRAEGVRSSRSGS